MTVSGTPNSPRAGGSHRVEGAKAPQSVEGAAPARSSGSSKVEGSDSAKQMSEISKLVREAPDVRIDLVNDIKSRIEAGTYEVNLDKLAEKLSDVI